MPQRRGEVAREKIRTRHLALRTEQAYLHWMRRYVKYHGGRHPREMGAAEVLSTSEVRSGLAQLDGTSWLIANLLYGSGLRLMEAMRLRVKDLLLECGEVLVRDAKGGKDRVTVLPSSLVVPFREHLTKLFARFERQRNLDEAGVSLPAALRANIRTQQRSGAGSGYFRLMRYAETSTMMYTHVMGRGAMGVKSPLDS